MSSCELKMDQVPKVSPYKTSRATGQSQTAGTAAWELEWSPGTTGGPGSMSLIHKATHSAVHSSCITDHKGQGCSCSVGSTGHHRVWVLPAQSHREDSHSSVCKPRHLQLTRVTFLSQSHHEAKPWSSHPWHEFTSVRSLGWQKNRTASIQADHSPT